VRADVVGSTALVQLNETVAHERIQDTFRRFSETIGGYGGIAHEIRGDALVAEFARASDAVSASLAFQASNTTHNEAVNLTNEELARAAKTETDVPEAYDVLLQGNDHFRRETPEDYAKAIRFFKEAIALDPDYSRAYAVSTRRWKDAREGAPVDEGVRNAGGSEGRAVMVRIGVRTLPRPERGLTSGRSWITRNAACTHDGRPALNHTCGIG
jgi:hypothetical protein